MPWYFYVLKCVDNSLYAGITTDIQRRLHEHNFTNRGAKYTRGRRPVELVHIDIFENRSQVSKAECIFKKLPTWKKRLIVNSSDVPVIGSPGDKVDK
jgi:putative endonuclease